MGTGGEIALGWETALLITRRKGRSEDGDTGRS